MLKKESFFQYLFVQSLGYSNTRFNNLANNSSVEISTVKRTPTLINKSLYPRNINESNLLKPLKLKTVKSQTFVFLFTKTKKQKNKPNYRVKFQSLVTTNYGTNSINSTEKKETKNSKTGNLVFNNIFLPTLGFSQQNNWLEKRTTKNQTNKSKKITLTRGDASDNLSTMPEAQINNKQLKMSQNIFLFNKELRKLYIPTEVKPEFFSTKNLEKKDKQNAVLRESFQQNLKLLTNYQLSQKSMPTGHKVLKKDKNKETSYNTFLSYKKSFLSYWLLPFFGLISLTGSNASSMFEGQRLSVKNSNQYSSLNGNHLTKGLQIPSFSKNSLDSNILNKQAKNNDYLYSKWEPSNGYKKIDSFEQNKKTPNSENSFLKNSSVNAVFLETKTPMLGKNSKSIGYYHKRLFFKIFDLTYNPNNQYLNNTDLGLTLNFEKTQKVKLASQINFKKLNFQFFKINLLKQNKFDYIWYDFFLKNYNSNSFSQTFSMTNGHIENNQYYFPNKLFCNLALSNNATFIKKLSSKYLSMLDRSQENDTKDLLLTKLNAYTIINSGISHEKMSIPQKTKEGVKGDNLALRAYSNWTDFLQTTKENIKLNTLQYQPKNILQNDLNKSSSMVLTWNLKKQENSEHFLFKQAETFTQNGRSHLTGISTFGNGAAHQNKKLSLFKLKEKKATQLYSLPEGFQSNKNLYKTTQLKESTIKAKYTKLLSSKKSLDYPNNVSKLKQKNNQKLVTIFTKTSKASKASGIDIQLTPEKSFKKALFLLDSVWLNSLCPSGMVDTKEKRTVSLLNNTVVNLIKKSSSLPEGYNESKNPGNLKNNEFFKNIQTLNNNIAFVLKTKSKKKTNRLFHLKTATGILTFEKGKIQSINNRNILYKCIFDGLKDNLNQIIQTTAYKDFSLPGLKNSLEPSNIEGSSFDRGYAAVKTRTVLKLNRPIFGGNVLNNNNLNSTDATPCKPIISNIFDPLKNTNKLNFKISNLPITLISPNLLFETASSMREEQSFTNKNKVFKEIEKQSTELSQKGNTATTNLLAPTEGHNQTKNLKIKPKLAETSLYQKREPFIIFGNYLNSITTKLKKGLGTLRETIPTIDPYQTNLGNNYLWSESFALKSQKPIKKTKLPKTERLFLSYLSHSKLGEKNRISLGLRSSNAVFLKQKLSNSKKVGSFDQSIKPVPQTWTVPLKIKKLAKNQLLLSRKNGTHGSSMHKGYAVGGNKKSNRLLNRANLNKIAYFKSNYRKSFTILLKNRLFVNKKQNGEYWGTLTNNSLTASKVDTDKIIQESRRKKQQIKLKRRLKKMQCATRRRKKRKIFYPRPKWLTFTMYENYLNSRFSSKENLITNPIFKTTKLGINLNKKQRVYSGSLINGKKWDKKSKDFYQISPIVSRDLRRILMKSNWLRNYLNPYLEKIKYIYNEIEKDSKSLNVFLQLKAFIQDLYGSNFQTKHFSKFPSVTSNGLGAGTLFEPSIVLKQNFNSNYQVRIKTKNDYSPTEQYNSILNFEYNRIIYQRLQRIILNIRENLNLNGQLKNRSQKLAKNIRPFIKRDYIKRDNPMTGNQSENIFTKTLKKNLLNFRRNFIMLNNGYEEPSIYTTESLSPLVRNNFYWALNRTEKALTTNSNSSYIKNIWEKYKIREINKNNKTKKMLFSLVKKYQDLLSDQNLLEPFYNNLETDFSISEDHRLNNQPKKFYKQKLFSPGPINNFIYVTANTTLGALGQLNSNLYNATSFETNTLLNLEKLNNRNNQSLQEFKSNGQQTNLNNTIELKQSFNSNYAFARGVAADKSGQAKIKRNLLATKNYIDKTETKLINVENKLKLLGLNTTKIFKPSSLYSSVEASSNSNGQNSITGIDSLSVKSLSTHNLFKVLVNNKQLLAPKVCVKQPYIRISPLQYKKTYFRFLKQNLLKENKFFVPYAKRKIEPFYLEKMEKLFYTIKQNSLTEKIATQNNLSGIKLTNNIQNYNKFSSTTYWWTKIQINKYLTPKYTVRTQNKYPESLATTPWAVFNQSYSNSLNLKPETGVFGLYTSSIKTSIASKSISIPLMSILFHFCTIITLVSLGGVKNVLKFYYILISKLYKVINTIRFAKVFPTKATSMSFGARGEAAGGGHRLKKTTLNVPTFSKGEKPLIKESLWPKTGNSVRNGHRLLVTTFKTIKLLTLKYLLVNVRSKLKKDINPVKNLNQNILSKNLNLTENNLNGSLIELKRSFNSNKQGKSSNGLSLIPSGGTLKTETKVIELVNFYLQSNKNAQKTNTLEKTKNLSIRGNQLNRIKVEFLFDTNKNVSIGLNLVHKISFYTYLLMLKSVDVLVAPAYLIYKFFEKPGEYVVENLAYSFLLEWSADLISTIPDSIDPALANYYMKLQRNLPLYLFLNPRNINIGLIEQNTIFSNLAIKSTGSNTMLFNPNNNNLLNLKTLVKTMESIFGIFVLSIQNSILRRFTNTSLLLFTQQITEPDSDFINRQKKGIIFWDLWGESLKTIAEKNAVNIYELSTDKTEQLKLLSNMQNSNLLNQSQNTFAFDQTKIYLRKASFLEPTRSLELKRSFNSISSSSFANNNYTQSQTALNTSISFKTQTSTHNWLSRLGNKIFGLNLLELDETLDKFSKKKYQNGLVFQKASLFETQRWAVNQFLNYQGKDTELFIDMHPPRSFANTATALKYSFALQAPIGSIVCQIFGGIFYKQISKNILVVLHNSSQTNKSLEKSLLIQAIAGETELKIITDNAHRYAMVIQGVAVGIKLLKDVFEALCATGPCIFLLEDIHAIGERRPFLIDEASPNLTESIYNKNQSMQAFLLKEKSSASREILYKTNKHLLTNYKKPYKEFKSLASNHFSFNFLYRGSSLTKRRTGDIHSTELPLSIQVSQKDKETQDTNLDKKASFDVTNTTKKVSNPNNILNKRYLSESKSQNSNSSNKVFGSFSQLIKTIKNKQSLINPPASSPFNLLLMKESTKLKPTQNVKEMAWFGLPGEQYSLVSKYNYSIRIKVALLADSVLSNLSVKLEMITDLLVIIDSVKGNRGFIIFATTHLPDILDPALRRPGRFDETLSLPFIPSLYSRWTNYRYNLQYLNNSLVKQYSIPFNSTFNKGTTLDFLKLPVSSSNSQMEALFPIYNSMKSFGRMSAHGYAVGSRLKTKNTDVISSNVPKYKTMDLSYLIKEFLRFSYSRSASYASNAILSLMLYTSLNNSEKNVNRNTQNKKLLLKNSDNPTLTVLKWPTLLRLGSSSVNESNFSSNIFENYSNYLSLFAPTYFNNSSFGQMLLLSFITYKMGETFGFSTNLKRHYSVRTLSTKSKLTGLSQQNLDKAKTESKPFGLRRSIGVVNPNQKATNKMSHLNSTRSKMKKTFACGVVASNPFVLNFSKNSEWKKGPSLLYSYLQKRLPQNKQKEKHNFNYSTFYSTQLLNFNNNYSLMEPPSPPITNILLPAKRYENYRRSFKNLYNLNIEQDTVSEKLKLHQQQRLLKRLYNYPIKEFFRNEKFSWWKQPSSLTQKGIVPTQIHKGNLNKFKAIGLKDKITFAQSYFTFAGIDNFAQKNMASLNKFSSIDYSYRNILYNRHKTYLTNQWWNGQQGEHNLETTFLSDIDWRYTQLSNSLSNDDIQVDFPDCDQFYNPRNRRWILTTGDWNHWFNVEADLNNIYSHYISESLTKAYKTIDQNREILDFYSAKLLSTSFNLLDLVDSLDTKSTTLESPDNKIINLNQNLLTKDYRGMSIPSFSKTNVNIAFNDLTHREILNLYKRFFYKTLFK